jgi:hypothetical protein
LRYVCVCLEGLKGCVRVCLLGLGDVCVFFCVRHVCVFIGFKGCVCVCCL